MISYIRGKLAATEKEKAIVDVHGVGYGIFMPGRAMALLPQTGNEVKIHTYLDVHEDSMQLYGFLTRDDLELFKLIIKVSGIGPKGGLNLLSCLSADELRFAVLAGDVKAITAAQGIGKKMAEKLILELKDKLNVTEVPSYVQPAVGVYSGPDAGGIQAEAVQALVALGYSSTESLKAVGSVKRDNMTVEDVLKEALKELL